METLLNHEARAEHRFSLLGPGPLAFFRDAKKLLDAADAGAVAYETASHLLGHLLRELESAVRTLLHAQLVQMPAAQQLPPDTPASQTRALVPREPIARGSDANIVQETADPKDLTACDSDREGQLRMLKAIFLTLDLPTDGEDFAAWRKMTKGETALAALAHRRALDRPRPLGPFLVDSARSFLAVLDIVLERFETRYGSVYQALDALLEKAQPARADVRRLQQQIPNTPQTLGYFFARLRHVNWLGPLSAAGYFRAAPPPTPLPDGSGTGLQHWMAVDYLQAIAAQKSTEVAEILLRVEDAGNLRTHAQFLRVATGLLPDDRAKLLNRLVIWSRTAASTHEADVVAALGVRYLQDGDFDAACAVCEGLLLLPEGWRTKPPSFPPSYSGDSAKLGFLSSEPAESLIASLMQQSASATLAFLADALRYHVGTAQGLDVASTWAAIGAPDYSTRWAADLGESVGRYESDLRVVLVRTVRGAISAQCSSDPAALPGCLDLLRARGSSVFRRIELAVLADLLEPTATDAAELVAHAAHQVLTDTALLQVGEFDTEIERLLPRAYPRLSQAQRDEVIRALVPPSRADEDADEHARAWEARWRRDRLQLIAEHLPPREQGELKALVTSHGNARSIAHDDRSRVTASFSATPSPLTEAEVEELAPEALIGFLSSWKPSGKEDAPSRHGLGQRLERVIARNPTRYATVADAFVKLHPDYGWAVLDGLVQAARADLSFPWRHPLTLIAHAAQPGWAVEALGAEHECNEQSIARHTRQACAELLALGLRLSDDGTLRSDLDLDSVWPTLAILLADHNPSPEYEKQQFLERTKPHHLAGTTVRSIAIDAAVAFAYARPHASEDGTRSYASALDRCPECAAALEAHLDSDQDPSLAVRAALGRWLGSLCATDPAWVEQHRAALLPRATEARDARRAVWDGYLHRSQPTPAALPLLEDEYRFEILNASEMPLASEQDREIESHSIARLGDHLLRLYWWGDLDFSGPDSLLALYFAHAPAAFRAHVLSDAGYALFHAKTPMPDDVLRRLMALWDWRAAALGIAEDLGDGGVRRVEDGGVTAVRRSVRAAPEVQRELREFGWWFASNLFPAQWALSRLHAVLLHCGTVELDYRVADVLASLAPGHAEQAAGCLNAVDFSGASQPWAMRGWMGCVEPVVLAARSSRDPKAIQSAVDALHTLVAAGHVEYRRLLNEHANTSSLASGQHESHESLED